jgi:septum formation protein
MTATPTISTPFPFIYLASQSPRRLELLAQWGVRCQTLLPNTDGDLAEDTEALEAVQPGDTPRRYVQRVTRLKLRAAMGRLARRKLPLAPVLCADTTVALGRDILGKPESPEHACEMLSRLAGREHRVLTAVAVGVPGHPSQPEGWLRVSESRVRFASLTVAQIRRYVDTGEPLGKAGAYGIQGRAALWVSHLSGSYTGIVGLPAFETAEVLRLAGVDLL